MRILAAIALVLITSTWASAEWQVKPFIGVTGGGGTTLIDPERAAGDAKVAFGGTVVLIGNVLGIEGDVGRTPSFFQSDDQHLVLRSRVTTLTGNLVIALPRRLTEYTLRPYVVGGAGMMRARVDAAVGLVLVEATLPAIDMGGGVAGFLTHRVGLGWDLRYFRSVHGSGEVRGASIGAEQLSFWRLNMALVIRY